MNRLDIINARMRALEAEAAEIVRFGDDTYVDGDVLTFSADFHGDRSFAYAAIKAGGTWHLTGSKSSSYLTWDVLVEFFTKANVRKVRLVTATKRVV